MYCGELTTVYTAQVDRLEKQLRALQSEVLQRTEDVMQLDQELAEKQTALQHSQSRISQLEHSEAALKDNVSGSGICGGL